MPKEISKELIDLFTSEEGRLFEPPKKSVRLSPDERLINSFQQINDFIEEKERLPEIEAEDINEATLAQRLMAIKSVKNKVEALKPFDHHGLLDEPDAPETVDELFKKDSLGLFSQDGVSVLEIQHDFVIPKKKQRPGLEPKAKRKRAEDFANFKPQFIEKHEGLAKGDLKLTYFTTVDQIKVGGFYVQEGMMLCVAEIGETVKMHGYSQQRMRVIYENGVESNMYRRSLAQRLYEGGLLVVDKNYVGEQQLIEADEIKGYIYVLKSESSDERIQTIKDLYKIGFTKTPVTDRIKNAVKDTTYLEANVSIVRSFTVTGDYNPQKIEYFLHRIFADAAVDLTIYDKHGAECKPKEWYSVPLQAIEQAVNMLSSGEITEYVFDSERRTMRPVNPQTS